MNHCDPIAQRLAAGDELNDDQRAHAELCEACSATVGATQTLRHIGQARASVEPGPGFSSRVANRAWERIAVRRRKRIAGFAVTGTALAAAAALVVALWQDGGPFATTAQPMAAPMAPPSMYEDDALLPADEPPDQEERDLLWLTDADRALEHSANWEFIETPVAPYALLLDEQSLEENE